MERRFPSNNVLLNKPKLWHAKYLDVHESKRCSVQALLHINHVAKQRTLVDMHFLEFYTALQWGMFAYFCPLHFTKQYVNKTVIHEAKVSELTVPYVAILILL